MWPEYPLLTCEEAVALERRCLSNESAEWDAMLRAGQALGRAAVRDFAWWQPWGSDRKLLILAGKGHNAGDAFLAAAEIASRTENLSITIVFVLGRDTLRPLAAKALNQLEEAVRGSIREVSVDELSQLEGEGFDLTFDGIFGLQYVPPMREPASSVIEWCARNRDCLGFRVAVDLPSGVSDQGCEGAFGADASYMIGTAKKAALDEKALPHVGRLRFLDIGFYPERPVLAADGMGTGALVKKVGRLRSTLSDKRTYGRIFVLGGSRQYPGAVLMASRSAVKAGAGLVTAMLPATISNRLASAAPEVMWMPLPVKPEGSFEAESARIIGKTVGERGVILIGPGLQVDRSNMFLVSRLLRECLLPIVLDAGALSTDVMTAKLSRPAHAGPVIVTPHMGEFDRMMGRDQGQYSRDELVEYARHYKVTIVLKGPVTRIAHQGALIHMPSGNPVLARGGSGDILAGLIAARLAAQPEDPLQAAKEAVAWHGLAADALGRERGEVAVQTTELLDYLAPAIRNRF